MNHNLSLALAIGGGLVGLVVLHSILAGQSAAASAITVGATLTSPFNVMPDTSGSLVNNATVSAPGGSGISSTDATAIGGQAAGGGFSGWTSQVFPNAPPGVPSAGWSAALAGMDDHSLTTAPAAPGGGGFLPSGVA